MPRRYRRHRIIDPSSSSSSSSSSSQLQRDGMVRAHHERARLFRIPHRHEPALPPRVSRPRDDAAQADHDALTACVGEAIGQSNVLPVKLTLKGKRG